MASLQILLIASMALLTTAQVIQDTPEVAQARAEHLRAHQAALGRSGANNNYNNNEDDGQYRPELYEQADEPAQQQQQQQFQPQYQQAQLQFNGNPQGAPASTFFQQQIPQNNRFLVPQQQQQQFAQFQPNPYQAQAQPQQFFNPNQQFNRPTQISVSQQPSGFNYNVQA